MKSSFEKYFDAQMTLGGCGLWIIGILVVLYFVYSWIMDIIDGDLQTIIITSSIVIILLSFFIPLIFARKINKTTNESAKIPVTGWKNKSASTMPKCPSSSWKKYWIEKTNTEWPETCSVKGCSHRAVFGSVVSNQNTTVDYVIPVCAWCCNERFEFSIKEETLYVQVEDK